MLYSYKVFYNIIVQRDFTTCSHTLANPVLNPNGIGPNSYIATLRHPIKSFQSSFPRLNSGRDTR